MAQQQRSFIVHVVGTLLTRLIAVLIALLLALGAVLTYRAVDGQRRARDESLNEIGRGATVLLAQLAVVPLEFADITELEKLARETRLLNSDIAYIAIIDSNGKLVASEPRGRTPAEQVLTGAEPAVLELVDGTHPILQYGLAIGGKGGGKQAVYIGIDRTNTNAEVSSTRLWSIGVTALLTLVCAVVVGLTSRAILKRVRLIDDKVARVVQDLRASASEMLAVSKQTESNATDEAAAVDETQRTMQALLEASNQIAEGAETVLNAAARTATASSTIAERISKLSDQAGKIRDVSEAIQQIADKSDILALNASLEGTKAGEAGRGFALVGAEMRRLAETVMGAARQIKQLANQMNDLSQSGVVAVEEGQRLSQETMETSKRITMITSQQRSGTEQVSQSMREVQQFTRHAVAGAGQTKATAEDLVRIAGELAALFKFNDEHAENARTPPRAGDA